MSRIKSIAVLALAGIAGLGTAMGNCQMLWI